MTDNRIEKIRAEIEKRMRVIKENFATDEASKTKHALTLRLIDHQELLAFIDSMQEEPVSDDLIVATNNYCVNVRKGYPRVMDETDRYICNAFKAGNKWKEEQMMTKAIDAHCFGFQGAALFSFRLPASNYLVGSKVKVIVIKGE